MIIHVMCHFCHTMTDPGRRLAPSHFEMSSASHVTFDNGSYNRGVRVETSLSMMGNFRRSSHNHFTMIQEENQQHEDQNSFQCTAGDALVCPQHHCRHCSCRSQFQGHSMFSLFESSMLERNKEKH